MKRTEADNVTRLPFGSALVFTLEMIPMLPKEVVQEILRSLGLPLDCKNAVTAVGNYIGSDNVNIVPTARDLIRVSADGCDYFSQGHVCISEDRYFDGSLRERRYINEKGKLSYTEGWGVDGKLHEKYISDDVYVVGPFFDSNFDDKEGSNNTIFYSLEGEETVSKAEWLWYVIRLCFKIRRYASLPDALLPLIKDYLFLRF